MAMVVCDRAYLSIIITIIPLWIILTALIVLVLLTFHRSFRSTKIYDDCTKQTAQFIYYVELRTGDTSGTYNRRRTTLTIDMFDDNQTTLARIAIPGHVIFGRKDTPAPTIEDEKYYDLRVTRFWLYRATKLKKVSTIRLTHSCLEADARIMVYGFELRTNEGGDDEHKQFFPILSYISAFGTTGKPNVCFDVEPTGTITAMGGFQDDNSFVSYQLSRVDYIILINLSASIIWCLTSFKDLFILYDENNAPIICLYRGAITGLISYSVVLIVGLIQKYYVKYNYALNIGIGFYAAVYYLVCVNIIIVSTCLWIYTTIYAYKYLCNTYYGNWVLTISVAVVEVVAFSIVNALIIWLIYLLNPKASEQYVLPEEYVLQQQQQQELAALPIPAVPTPSKRLFSLSRSADQQHLANSGANYYTLGSSKRDKYPHQYLLGATNQTAAQQAWPQQNSNQLPFLLPAAAGSPYQAAAPGYGAVSPVYSPMQPQGHHPMITLNASYLTQQTAPHNAAAGSFKPLPAAYSPSPQHPISPLQHHQHQQAGYHQQAIVTPPPPPLPSPLLPSVSPGAAASPNQSGTGGKAAGAGAGGGGGTVRRVGSNESTGSTYYQQLMKNKGGVKSISQYGELLKQKKQQHQTKHNKQM